MTLSYGGVSPQVLVSVTNDFGRALSFTYDVSNRLTRVSDDTGRAVAYAYDAAGNLTSFTDPLGAVTRYVYDQPGRLTQVFNPAFPDTPFVANTYDSFGRVKTQAGANNSGTNNTTWEYFLAGARSEEVDPLGVRRVTYATPRGKTRAEIQDWGGLNLVTTSSYDGLDRLVGTTLPEGNSLGYAYDARNNLPSATATPKPGSPLAALSTTYEYDAVWNKPSRIDAPCCDPGAPGRQVTVLSYAPGNGNLTAVQRDQGGGSHFNATTRLSYTAQGQLASVTDPLDVVTRYAYDAAGNQISITRDEGGLNQLTQIGYDPAGNVIRLTDPNGNVTRSAYDAARRPVSVTAPPASGLVTAFAYDADGRVVQTQQSAGGAVLRSTSTSYTPTGKPLSATDANGNVTRYAYDRMDRLSELRDAAGRITGFAYDTLGRRTQVLNTAIQAQPLERRAYTPNGRLASLTDAIGTATAYSYDGFDRLDRTTYADASYEQNSYDLGGNMLTRRTRAGDSIAFTYDTLNRLTSKTPPSPAPVVSYGYDLTGRLTSLRDTSTAIHSIAPPSGAPLGAVAYTANTSYDALNRTTTVNWDNVVAPTTPTTSTVSFTHGYNAVNQRVSQQTTDAGWWYVPSAPAQPGGLSFGYDAENRLTSASGTGMSATYAYDAQGRRKTKTVNGTTTVYVTDPDNREILEYDGASGVVQRLYAYGPGIDEVLAQVNVAANYTASNQRLSLIADLQGSIIGTIDAGSGTVSKAGFAPFGESAGTSGAYRYTGRRIDAETGGLYYYRARTYDPIAGRFLQSDPIGYGAGVNLYVYVSNDPLNSLDPFGFVGMAFGYRLSSLVGDNDTLRQAIVQFTDLGSAGTQFVLDNPRTSFVGAAIGGFLLGAGAALIAGAPLVAAPVAAETGSLPVARC